MKRAALGLLSVILVTSAQQGARLLIISYDSYAPQLQAFADWKSKSGLLARVVPLSQVGRTQDSIRNYVLNAYNTWNPRPEFLLLVGANTQIPAYSYFTDNYFGDMTGDFRAELDVGRWPCRNARQCSVMVSKSLNYERYPSLTDSTWFKKGTFIVREDPGPDDSIYWSDARTSCSAMRASGFSEIDTFSYLQGHNASDVVSAVNSGRSFIAYRGVATVNWYTPFAVNPSLTTNGFQLPIILSATCMTVSLVPNESMISDGWLRAGTVNAPKGAVAFFGNTHAASHVAPVRSAICRGFVQAYFRDSVPFLGQACRAGREQMYSEFGNSTEYQGFTLEGDPTLRYWTAKPVTATVTYDSVIPVGSSNFTVQVTRSGVPVRNALVCVRKGTEVYTWGLTNSSGQVVLA
ncbi:MAG: C25 family cysteine peptidase, partial [candidate division WOR-3 bacterium]